MNLRRSLAAGMACLAFAGCSRASAPVADPSSTGGNASQRTASDISATQVEWPDLPGASSVQGLVVQKVKNETRGARSSTVRVASPSALADDVNDWVKAQTERFSKAAAKAPDASQASLAMEPSVCGASGQVLCFVVDSTAATGSQSTETSQAWFVDVDDGTVLRAEDLFSGEGASRVRELMDAIVGRPGESPASTTTSDSRSSSGRSKSARAASDYLHGAYFDADGSLVLLVPDMRPATGASLSAYRIEGKGVDDLLTPKGRQMRKTIMSGRAPSALPTPSPTSNPAPAPAPSAAPSQQGEPSQQGDAPQTSQREKVDCARTACIALTFDDGPGPQTPQLLDTLKAKGVPATFFVIGPHAQAYPQTVARAAKEGHVIGNHTWNHPVLTKLNPMAVANELTSTSAQIVNAGAPTPVLMRPPYGAKNPSVTSIIGQHGMVSVMWDVDTEDWKNRSTEVTTQRALAGAHPGAIILMHDIHPSTVAAIPGLIDQLRARGYTLVTVPELLGDNPQAYIGRQVYSQTLIK